MSKTFWIKKFLDPNEHWVQKMLGPKKYCRLCKDELRLSWGSDNTTTNESKEFWPRKIIYHWATGPVKPARARLCQAQISLSYLATRYPLLPLTPATLKAELWPAVEPWRHSPWPVVVLEGDWAKLETKLSSASAVAAGYLAELGNKTWTPGYWYNI